MAAATITYPLTIEGLTPTALPMRRLAEYIGTYAALLGSTEHVRLEGVFEGSLVIQACAPRDCAREIEPRLVGASTGAGSPDAVRAFRQLNGLLAGDEATARLPLSGGEIISFPGREGRSEPIEVRDHVEIQGRLTRLEGGGDPVGVGLEDEGRSAGRVFVPAALASELGRHFQKPMRLAGEGKWRRDETGRWSLEAVTATSFELLEDTPLSEVLARAGRHLSDEDAADLVEAIRDLRR
ncbi:hypothetical protein [Salinarimonas sp.]|uniref:hypothetical protein n=1 Tax=Salinarimonas sp. TaxID=2766526 RepID=UPI0032D8CA14